MKQTDLMKQTERKKKVLRSVVDLYIRTQFCAQACCPAVLPEGFWIVRKKMSS